MDPVTGVHTQEVESRWADLKLGLKLRKGIRQTDLQSYLDYKMWCQWKGGGVKRQMFENFIRALERQFPIVPI